MKKTIIWTIVAVLIIIAATMGILYYTTDLFKSQEQIFYRRLSESTNLLGKASYEDAVDDIKKSQEKTAEVAGEINVKITSEDKDTQAIAEAIEKGKVTYNMTTIGKEQKAQGDMTLNYNNQDIVTLNFLQNKDQYGIKLADAYDKYISVENNNLKEMFKKFGVEDESIPDKIEMLNYYDILSIDKTTLNHIKDTYTKIITENIPQESYSTQKDVTTKVKDTDVKTNAYKLSLTEEQCKTILTKVLETLKTDDVTLDLIISKYAKVIEPYKMLGEDAPAEITKDELVKEIEDEIDSLNSIDASKDEMVEIIVYGARNGLTKIEVAIQESKDNVIKADLSMINTSDNKELIFGTTIEEDTTMSVDVIYKDNEINEVIEIGTEGTTVAITLKQEIKDTKAFMVEDFTAENSVKLNDMEQKDLETLVETISTNVIKVLPQKAQMLGINLQGLLGA